MNEKEKIEHEAIKNVIKMGIMNNQYLDDTQKQTAIINIDKAAQKADWFIELLRLCGFIDRKS